MTNRDYSFFGAAKEVSKLSPYPRHHLGCVIVDKNRIVSSGFNSDKSNPLQKRYNAVRFSADTPHKLHAETAALLPLLKSRDMDLSRLKVYLYREHADGTFAMSRPCPSCMAMFHDAGIKHLYYTTDAGYAEEKLI